MTCEQCNGTGRIFGFVGMQIKDIMECDLCNGKGEINSNTQLRIIQGRLLKTKRLKSGLSLRAFCKVNNLDASNVSKIERGVNKNTLVISKLIYQTNPKEGE